MEEHSSGDSVGGLGCEDLCRYLQRILRLQGPNTHTIRLDVHFFLPTASVAEQPKNM